MKSVRRNFHHAKETAQGFQKGYVRGARYGDMAVKGVQGAHNFAMGHQYILETTRDARGMGVPQLAGVERAMTKYATGVAKYKSLQNNENS